MQLSAPLVGDILFVSGLGLFGSAFLRAGKFWPLLIYFYLALLSGLMFTGLAVLALAVPDPFVDFISLIQVGITEINDGEKGVQIAHDFGTVCAFMLFLFLLGVLAYILCPQPSDKLFSCPFSTDPCHSAFDL